MQMRVKYELLALALVAIIASGGYCSDARPHGPLPVNVCGRNAAFVMLALLGHDIDYERVCSQIPDLSEGVSLTELRHALAVLGVKASIVQLSPTDLSETPLPCIVWLRQGYLPGDLGHYVVVTEASHKGVTIINAQNAEHKHWPWRFFSDAWTGYALVAPVESEVNYLQIVCLVVPSVLVLIAILRFSSSNARRNIPTAAMQ